MMAVQFYNSATLPQLLSHFNLNLSQSVTPVKAKFKLIWLKMWIQFDTIRARVRTTYGAALEVNRIWLVMAKKPGPYLTQYLMLRKMPKLFLHICQIRNRRSE